MQSFYAENTIEICKSAPKMSNFAKLGENIYSIEQRVNNITGRIIVTNAAAVVEIRCKLGQLVMSTRGLAIFMISPDCLFTMGGQIIIEPRLNTAGFEPTFLFGLNRTLVRSKLIIIDYHKIGNSVMAATFCLIGTVIFIIICVKCSFKRTEIQYNYIAPAQEEEMQVLN